MTPSAGCGAGPDSGAPGAGGAGGSGAPGGVKSGNSRWLKKSTAAAIRAPMPTMATPMPTAPKIPLQLTAGSQATDVCGVDGQESGFGVGVGVASAGGHSTGWHTFGVG
ncbi:hypothetical protein [Corynebacterium lizhenjunii]|uniref:hypothetical protein n=1 Tax=Corynebacterium lizhenjunii TaxID=2709394 RepID=UPI0013ED904F|nr:hypothetical protein [Corynebacterium lizhenjunii]